MEFGIEYQNNCWRNRGHCRGTRQTFKVKVYNLINPSAFFVCGSQVLTIKSFWNFDHRPFWTIESVQFYSSVTESPTLSHWDASKVDDLELKWTGERILNWMVQTAESRRSAKVAHTGHDPVIMMTAHFRQNSSQAISKSFIFILTFRTSEISFEFHNWVNILEIFKNFN